MQTHGVVTQKEHLELYVRVQSPFATGIQWLALNTIQFRKEWCLAVRVVCVWLTLLVL